MNFIERMVELILPYTIAVLEIMGILVVVWSSIQAFWRYIKNTFFHSNFNLQLFFAKGLATGLEFKMAAEILKTVLIREMSELLILGAVIILRAVLSILIHLELKQSKENIEE